MNIDNKLNLSDPFLKTVHQKKQPMSSDQSIFSEKDY